MPLTLLPPPLSREDALTRRLDSLVGRMRRTIILREGSKLLATIVVALLLIAFVDQRWGLPSFVRALLLTGSLAGTVLLVRRRLLNPLNHVGDELAMAHRIERRFPEFNDSLISAVQFLKQDPDAQTCSPSLRRAAIRRALKKSERYDFEAAIPTRWTKRWFFLAFVSVLALAVLVRAYPAAAKAEWQRLAMPYGGALPVAQTKIAIVAPKTFPHRMARGEPLDIAVNIAGLVPDRASVSIQFEGGATFEQSYPIPNDPGSNVADAMFRLEATRINKNFQFRVRAHDADTGWQQVSVLPPPMLVPLDGRPSPQIELTFPRYTDLPPETMDGAGRLKCIAGTQVTIRAATDRPVHRAWIAWQPDQPMMLVVPHLALLGPKSPQAVAGLDLLARTVWEPVPVRISESGLRMDVSFVPRLTGAYAFHFEDETGLGATRTFAIQVDPDPAPEVTIEQPSPKQDVHLMLPDAEFTLQSIVKDHVFAIRRVQLEYRTGLAEALRTVPIYDASYAGRAIPLLANAMRGLPVPGPDDLRLRLTTLTLNERLRVPQFRKIDGTALKEGDFLLLNVAADDFDDVTGFKQPGRSQAIVIQIVSKNDLEVVQQQAQSDIRLELLQLQAQQRVARTNVQEAQRQLQTTGMLRPQDRDLLEQADQLQQQIRNRINNPTDGLREQLNQLKKLAEENRLPRSAVMDRLNDATAELDRLAREELEPLQNDLATARKTDAKETQQGALAKVEKRQKEVEQTIQGLLERLEPWSGVGEVRGETRSVVGEVKRNLEKINNLAEKLPPNAQPDQLTPQQRAELERAALNDERAAERVRQVVEKMLRLAAEKEKAANEKRTLASQLAHQAATQNDLANQAPMGSPEQKNHQQQANELTSQANSAKANADDLQREAEALRASAQAGNSEELKEQMRSVGALTRQNQLNRSATQQKAALGNLERMLQAMEDHQQADADRLTKSLKNNNQELENLIDEQEKLQKKIRAAEKIADPTERQAALEKLSREQEKLEQQARELAQKLSRNQGEEAAQELRRAAREMALAREQIDVGEPAANKLTDALERLDNAQMELDNVREKNADALQREQTAKLGDKIKTLRERQQRMLDESIRLHAVVKKDKKWERAVRTSLNDLRQQQQMLAPEVRQLMEGEFEKAIVYNRMLRQAADAMELAARRMDHRLDAAETGPFDLELEDIADAGIRAQQQLALKRFDQLFEALKPEQQQANANTPPPPMMGGMNEPMPPMPKGERLPPLAQLKALRALQADIAERTAAFDQAHPDLTKLNDDEADELDSLTKMQVDVAELIKQLTAMAEGETP